MTSDAPPQRILVVRLSALGDVMITSGLVPTLRSLYPNAYLAWLVEPPAAPLLRHNPRIDELIVWPRTDWIRLWRERRWRVLMLEMSAFRRRLATGRFDLVIDAQGLLKSGVLAWLTRARRRIGVYPREGSGRLMTESVVPPMRGGGLLGAEYRLLAARLGAAPSSFRLDLVIGPDAREAAAAALAACGVNASHAVLCPFTTRPQKHWFEDRWAALGDRLAAAGLRPVLLGGPGDAAAAARIRAASASAEIVDLAGRLPLDASLAVVAASRLVVGVDTGLTHAGSAFRIPTVALFGSTRPYVDAGTPGTTVLFEPLECAPCHRRPTCGGAFDCMRALTVEHVFAAAMSRCAAGLRAANPG